MTEYIKNPLSGKLRGVTYEDGKIIDVHIRDTDDVVKVFVPVRHGRWICIRKGYGEYECSVCHGVDSDCSDYYGTHVVTEQDYCPNCGSRMDGDDDALTVPVRKRTRGYRPSASCGAKMDLEDSECDT